MQRWRLKTIRGQNTLLHDNVWYLSGVFSPQYVVNASVDVFQRVLVGKMAAFVQLAVFDVVLDLVVYRQTSTVVDTPQIALLWVWSHRIVKDMADKLFVMIGVLLLIKRDLFTFSSGVVALYLKSWNKYTKKLCNYHSHTPLLRDYVSHNVVLVQITKLRYRPSLCVNQRARYQSTESQKITSQYKYSRLGKVTKTSDKMDVSNYGAQITWCRCST